MKDLFDIFEIEKTCEYKGEVYRVRDNGCIFRLRKSKNKKRPLDEKWTLGKVNKQRGYLYFSSEVVHRIVATAFHKQPSKNHNIVDHIDTNRQNNRPENLRWVTRLDNILLNPISCRKIIYKYGSIDEFLANPSEPKSGYLEQNFTWMRSVTKEEADNCRKNFENWAKEGKTPKGGKLGEWIFKRINKKEDSLTADYILSKTPNAAQRIYFIEDKPDEWPSTPKTITSNPLKSYYKNLKKGAVFYRNHNGEYVVVKRGYTKDNKSLYILTRANYIYDENEDGEFGPIPVSKIKKKISVKDLRHSLTEVTFENNLFMHESERGLYTNTELLKQKFTDNTFK